MPIARPMRNSSTLDQNSIPLQLLSLGVSIRRFHCCHCSRHSAAGGETSSFHTRHKVKRCEVSPLALCSLLQSTGRRQSTSFELGHILRRRQRPGGRWMCAQASCRRSPAPGSSLLAAQPGRRRAPPANCQRNARTTVAPPLARLQCACPRGDYLLLAGPSRPPGASVRADLTLLIQQAASEENRPKQAEAETPFDEKTSSEEKR